MSPTEPVHNRRISSIRPLLSPALLREEHPLTAGREAAVRRGREAVTAVIDGADDRLLVVVGPCSIHDPDAALDYAHRLAQVAERHAGDLLVVMRVYFEKPRTTIGWKGLINDPDLDGSFQVNAGLRLARRLLLDIIDIGLPVGCEFLDPVTPQYLADAVSWGSIGARTAQSQIHRQLASGLSMPIGIKNATDGNVQVAVDAVSAAASSHVFTGVDDAGLAAILTTAGNPDCHVVLRGSATGPNYDRSSIDDTLDRLTLAGLPRRVVVDASHGNSDKDHRRQVAVLDDVAALVAAGTPGLVGVMSESFLTAGGQELVLGQAAGLVYGQSVTDACMGWTETQAALERLASAAAARRRMRSDLGRLGVEDVDQLGVELAEVALD